jgi:hypothetical protein
MALGKWLIPTIALAAIGVAALPAQSAPVRGAQTLDKAASSSAVEQAHYYRRHGHYYRYYRYHRPHHYRYFRYYRPYRHHHHRHYYRRHWW